MNVGLVSTYKGLGVRESLSAESTPETQLVMGSRNSCENIQRCARPLTPDLSPTLGRREPQSIEFFEGTRNIVTIFCISLEICVPAAHLLG